MIALRDLKTHATLSEKHISNLQKIVHNSTTSALIVNNANLGFYASDAADASSITCSSLSHSSQFSALAFQAEKTIEFNSPIVSFEWI